MSARSAARQPGHSTQPGRWTSRATHQKRDGLQRAHQEALHAKCSYLTPGDMAHRSAPSSARTTSCGDRSGTTPRPATDGTLHRNIRIRCRESETKWVTAVLTIQPTLQAKITHLALRSVACTGCLVPTGTCIAQRCFLCCQNELPGELRGMGGLVGYANAHVLRSQLEHASCSVFISTCNSTQEARAQRVRTCICCTVQRRCPPHCRWLHHAMPHATWHCRRHTPHS